MIPENDTWTTEATGAKGRVSLDLLSIGESPRRWRLAVGCGQFDVCFEVSGRDVLYLMSEFVARHSGSERREEARVGSFSGCEVFIVKGDIHPQQFHLLARGGDAFFNLLLAGDDSVSFAHALRLAVEDLDATSEKA